MKSTHRPVKGTKSSSKALGTMHAHHFSIAERERSIYDSCRFDIGRSRTSRPITKCVYTRVTYLHIAVPTITRSLRHV